MFPVDTLPGAVRLSRCSGRESSYRFQRPRGCRLGAFRFWILRGGRSPQTRPQIMRRLRSPPHGEREVNSSRVSILKRHEGLGVCIANVVGDCDIPKLPLGRLLARSGDDLVGPSACISHRLGFGLERPFLGAEVVDAVRVAEAECPHHALMRNRVLIARQKHHSSGRLTSSWHYCHATVVGFPTTWSIPSMMRLCTERPRSSASRTSAA
jgi:hypothetical protein